MVERLGAKLLLVAASGLFLSCSVKDDNRSATSEETESATAGLRAAEREIDEIAVGEDPAPPTGSVDLCESGNCEVRTCNFSSPGTVGDAYVPPTDPSPPADPSATLTCEYNEERGGFTFAGDPRGQVYPNWDECLASAQAFAETQVANVCLSLEIQASQACNSAASSADCHATPSFSGRCESNYSEWRQRGSGKAGIDVHIWFEYTCEGTGLKIECNGETPNLEDLEATIQRL